MRTNRWRDLTDEQKRDFIERTRAEAADTELARLFGMSDRTATNCRLRIIGRRVKQAQGEPREE